MIKIEIQNYTNGYSLTVFDDHDGYLVRELADTRIEILNTMLSIITDLTLREKKRLAAAV